MNAWRTSLILLAVSLAATALMWYRGFPFFFLFLFIPIIPLLRRDRHVRRCPACGWETTGSERFCPWDATPLEGPGGKTGEGKD
jgi:hypothetical protein